MKLPYHKSAYIPKAKLTQYILSQTHEVGRFKAAFFFAIGYDESNAHLLEKALLNIAMSQNVKETIITEYGTKYIIDGELKVPNQDITKKVRTVWVIENEQKIPHFVTVYPV